MSLRDCQKKAIKKWNEANTYKRSITFFNNSFPIEKYNKAKEILDKQGISLNSFFKEKLQEVIDRESEV